MHRFGFNRTKCGLLTALFVLTLLSQPLAAEQIKIEIPGSTDPAQAISAEDLTVEVAGQPAEVLSIGDGQPSSRVVIYVDQLLSSPLSVHNGLLELAEQASKLVDLGTIEVVSAGEEVRPSVPATQSAEQLAEALGWLKLRNRSEGGQLVVRKGFVDGAALSELVENEHLAISATGGQRLAQITSLLREALAQEAELLTRYRQQLLAWAADEVSREPKILLLVGGGFDADFAQFYRELLRPFELDSLVDSEVIPEVSPTIADLAKTLSAVGWSVWPYSPDAARVLEEGEEKARAEVITTFEGGKRVDRTVITPRFDALDGLKRLLGGKGESIPVAALLAPREPLRELAREAGGRVMEDRAQLVSALTALSRRVVVTAEAELPALMTGLVPVSVSLNRASGNGGRVSTRRWAGSGMPELLSVVRAQQLLDGDIAEGGLFVEAIAEERPDSGSLRLEVIVGRSLAAEGAALPERILVTSVAFEPDGQLSSERRQLSGGEVVDGAFSVELGTMASPDTPVVVIVEDLESGQWGGAYATLVASSGFDALGGLGGLLPAPRAIHLLAPREPLAIGKFRIETVLSDRVRKVKFYLDGKLETVRKSAPFSVPVTLGRYPDRHSVEAVAYDSEGLEVGRDRLILNAGTGTFRVRILSPEPGTASAPIAGPVVVRAAVEQPRGSELKRVQFYWNETLFATRYAPPFVQRFPIPDDGPSGFFRVEALLADGSQTEDVLFVNSPGGSEQVRVELVELFTVVTDREGHPVTRLPAEAFRVFEDGVEQEVSTFTEAGDLPLTVGLAIDSSASMFVKLPDVQRAAASFVKALESTEDRAFVVRFGGGPKLVRDTTRDLASVEKSLFSLEPDGRTEIWKGIVYSLVQLQSVPGKKALIIFSDGADEDPDFSYRTCLRFARRVGVPVYVIVSNDEIYRTQGKGLTIRGFMGRLRELAKSVGGRVFVTRVGGDLSAIYGKIDEELRSQYLLGYYARDDGGESFHEVSVDVDGSGLKARTIAGYYR